MNIIDFLKSKLIPPAPTVSKDQLQAAKGNEQNIDLLKKFGIVSTDLRKAIEDQTLVLYERSQLYQSVDRSLTHPLMSAATGIYADVATTRSQLQDSTVWVTSKNKEYQYQIEKMLDIINLEEVIFDWAWTITTFGDLFVQVFGQPGIGIVSVNDDQHPVNISRVDYNGRLVGFYETPMGYCLRGDTEIRLLNGRSVSIKEMADNADQYIGKGIYSCDEQGNVVPRKILKVGMTRPKTTFVRVHLDNGKYFDVTPDHKCMLRNGEFKNAEELQPNESLMPIYTQVNEGEYLRGYELVYNPKDNAWHYTHRLVAKESFKINKIKRGYTVHHINYNRLDNDFDNIKLMATPDHTELHKSIGTYTWANPKKNPMNLPVSIAKHQKSMEKAGARRKGKRFEDLVGEEKGKEWRERIGNALLGNHYNPNFGGTNFHKEDCQCLVCLNRRGESHKEGCGCCSCKAGRGEFKGAANGRYKNHKVVRVERLNVVEDAYDITVEGDVHTFALGAGVFVHNSVADERKLLTPWDYVHFRLLGAKKRRPIYQDPQYSEFRTISIMTPDIRRLTSKYGTSVLADALPIWKRMRLTEDSILMARINKTPTRYIYKITIPEGNANAESVANLIDQYISELKRARALNTDPTAPNYVDRFQGMGALEDIIVPVWGSTDNFNIEKIGGETDIRWIADVEELRNQLATALRVPLGLLSGYSKEGNPGGLGQNSIERMDIRFARQARRVQRSLLNGLTRLAQIHLAYQGINPDLNLFEIHMAETSTAEEEELKDALDKGVDVADKLYEFYAKALGPDFNGRACAEYINKKFLKLNDADLDSWMLKGAAAAFAKPERTEEPVPGVETPAPAAGRPAPPAAPTGAPEEGGEAEGEEMNPFRESITVSDLKSALPTSHKDLRINEVVTSVGVNEEWEKNWGSKMVRVEPKENK